MGDLLREDEVSVLLNVSVSTVRKWRMEKKGPMYIKLERSVRYPMSSVKDYIAKNIISTTNAP